MSSKERRKFSRVVTENLHLNITLTGDDFQSVSQIRGRIVNFSLDGLQIETQYPIASKEVYLRVTNSENNPDEIRGRVVYCEKISPEIFHVGIGFIGPNMDKYKFISQIMTIKDDMTTLELESIHKGKPSNRSGALRCRKGR
jgi:hypothetical protein